MCVTSIFNKSPIGLEVIDFEKNMKKLANLLLTCVSEELSLVMNCGHDYSVTYPSHSYSMVHCIHHHA